MPQPFISIIIPVFNNAQDIRRCLKSVLRQTFDDIEVIVVDDGSSDGSIDTIRSCATDHSRIRIFKEAHHGVSSARNVGIEASRGEYIIFIDADDDIEEHYLHNLADKAKQSHADILLCGITRCFADGHTEGWELARKGIFSRKDFLKDLPSEQYERLQGIYGFVANKMVKREIVNRFNLRFDATMSLMEDYSFFLDCYARCESFMCLSEMGYRYRIHDDHLRENNPREVSYMQLIDVQTKCVELLKRETVWTATNKHILFDVIGRLVLAIFLEMRAVNTTLIRSYLSYVGQNRYCIPALQILHTNKKILKYLILMKNVTFLQLYVKAWRFYLHARTWRKS